MRQNPQLTALIYQITSLLLVRVVYTRNASIDLYNPSNGIYAFPTPSLIRRVMPLGIFYKMSIGRIMT